MEKITVQELATMHGVSTSTARRWCNQGQIEAEKKGRDWFIVEGVAKNFQPPKAGRPTSKR